jgi:hypothetical protein
MEIDGSLLREKFILHDLDQKGKNAEAMTVLSNRMDLTLRGGQDYEENFVIRAHNMHISTRMASKIANSFSRLGSLVNRTTPYEWEDDWKVIFNDYERAYNEHVWICVYNNGRPLFHYGEYPQFLDIIENFSQKNPEHYDRSLSTAEQAFKDNGKNIEIEYDGNVALVLTLDDLQARAGIIHRGPTRSTAFNFTARPDEGQKKVNIPQAIGVAAAFLEGVQLAFTIGMDDEKIVLGIIERFSREEKRAREAKQRLKRLNNEIVNLEKSHNVRYRPEKPDFEMLKSEAEKLAQRVLEPPAPKVEAQPDPEEDDLEADGVTKTLFK